MASWSKVKVGDTITFKTWHLRSGYTTVKRKVVEIIGGVQVRMYGYSNFYLGMKGDKLISIEKSKT